ncbi:unnamed protein product [Oncorhynchus mykiss]|uniref:Uncharacterized protein n=1 Tax=Oncorhynchus mykiss TaxID=8022 RepID=A0A060W6Y0_ONCMY|nr:unnamed protein product [Oncorhynchus mykiss]
MSQKREILFDYEQYEYRGTSPAPEAGEAEVQLHGHVNQRESVRSHRIIVQEIQYEGHRYPDARRSLWLQESFPGQCGARCCRPAGEH